MTSTLEKKKFTYADYLKTPDDQRYELIEGELTMTSSPVTFHQWISKNILYELEKFVKDKKAGKVDSVLPVFFTLSANPRQSSENLHL